MGKRRKFRQGAASFYIVAISTLILVIIGASFAAVIISEVTRTSNDDLAQSAYDSALAGIEDGKLAYYNYQKCKDNIADPDSTRLGDGAVTCTEMVNWVEGQGGPGDDYNDCDIVANSLGRNIETGSNGESLGVLVQEGQQEASGELMDNMQQYYTCVKIQSQTQDVLGMLNENRQEHAVRIRFRKDEAHPDPINDAEYVRLSWHSLEDGANGDGDRGLSFMTAGAGGGIFEPEGKKPAVVSLAMVQTGWQFDMSSFDVSQGNQTNRGTLYFVPQLSLDLNAGNTVIDGDSSYAAFTKSNDKQIKNEPYLVDCNTAQSDYACVATAKIPDPIGGDRSEDTFVFSVALPYGGPQTHFRLEFLDQNMQPLTLDGVQISIDSTGRANDLFRRVETRMEPADAAYRYPILGIQALDPDGKPSIWKNFYTACEYNFGDPNATC